MLKKVLLTAALLSLATCGFRVIYEERNDTVSYAEELAAIRIQKDRSKLGQDLKNNLYDLFNPDYIKAEPKYLLVVKPTRAISATYITTTGASGRNRLTLTVSYEISSLETGKKISSGNTSVNDNYDVSTNRFGTYTAEEYIQTNLTKIAAQNIRNSIVNDIIEMRKKCLKEAENKDSTTKVEVKENAEKNEENKESIDPSNAECPVNNLEIDKLQKKPEEKEPEAKKPAKKSANKQRLKQR